MILGKSGYLKQTGDSGGSRGGTLELGGIRKIKTVRYCFKIPRYN